MVNRKGLVLFLLALFVAPFSCAQSFGALAVNGTTVQGGQDFASLIANRSISAVASNGSRAVVPVQASATISKAAMASAAAKLVRGASVVGAAYTGYEVYKWIQESGIQTCAPPDFFCKPETNTQVTTTYRYGTGSFTSSPSSACESYRAAVSANPANAGYTFTAALQSNGDCQLSYTGEATGVITRPQEVLTTCADGSPAIGNSCGTPGTSGAPYTEAELASGLIGSGTNWDPARSKKMLEAIQADSAKQPGVLTPTDIVPANSPLTVTGSPVSTPEVTTSTKVSPNQDGSTSTTTKKETTTFTPDKTGPTVGTGQVVAKESTVVTTTVTNNTTNVTNTTTETNTPAAPSEPPPDLCAQNPDIVACKKLGTLEATPVVNVDKPVSIVADTGWGASNGGCPSPGSFTAMGKTIPVPWDVFCQFAQGIRPFLIAVAYMIAVGGFIGLSRKD